VIHFAEAMEVGDAGGDEQTGELFSCVHLEKRVRSGSSLESDQRIVNEALVALEQEFAAFYAPAGRPR